MWNSGPAGWSDDSVKTYLSNEEFLRMAKQGYIGTWGLTTDHLRKVVQASLNAGRGLIIAIDETEHEHARHLRHG